MIDKIVSIYGQLAAQTPFNSDQLVVEISNTHIAAWVKLAAQSEIGAFELFSFDTNTNSWYDIFYELRAQSRILDRGYIDTRVFYNLPEQILMPSSRFNPAAAETCMSAMHGENINDLIKFDEIKVAQPLTTVYKVNKQLNDMVSGNMMMITARHSVSVLLEDVLHPNKPYNNLFMKVQFYPKHFMVAVTQMGKLLLAQSYEQHGPEDVIYHLINIATQYHLSTNDTVVELSGLLDKKSLLFEHLRKVFPKFKFDDLAENKKFHPDFDKYPASFLTPFLNLVP